MRRGACRFQRGAARPLLLLFIGPMASLIAVLPLQGMFATECPPPAVSLQLDHVRELAILSDSYGQNYFRPGCGNGREAATRGWLELEKIARATPYPLLKLLNDPDREVRGPCALVLGWVQERRAADWLVLMLGDHDAGIRCCAAAALGKIGDRSAVPALIGALRDRDPEVRRVTARALGDLGDPRALAPLRALLARATKREKDPYGTAWSLKLAISQITGDPPAAP